LSDPKPAETVTVAVIGGETVAVPTRLPVLPVRDTVVLPGLNAPLSVGRPRSLATLAGVGPGGLLLIATQISPDTEVPGRDDLVPVACVARVLRVVGDQQATQQALVLGLVRARILDIEDGGGETAALQATIEPIEESLEMTAEAETARERVIGLAHRVIDLRDDTPEEWKGFVSQIPSPGLLADLIAANLAVGHEDRVALLLEPEPVPRLLKVAGFLEREVTIAETQHALRRESGDDEMDPRRRERLLRRRMRDIQKELGEEDGAEREADELAERIETAELPEHAASHADRELKRFRALPQHAPDRHLLRTYLEWLADLPWAVETEDQLDLALGKAVLDEDHHDLEKVKDRILEYLAVRKLAPGAKAPILCFAGPPGVGKTSLGRSIARALGRNFARASLGGVRDEAEIRGHRRTYVGAMPGRILQNLRRAGSRNPVFVLDEVDKLGADFRGDPSSALLEVLDPEQNHTFSDHYLEIPFDLSRVLFIATANNLATIPPALLDRMEVIELPGYTESDKRVIARDHLIPKQLEAHGLDRDRVQVADEAVDLVVREYTREAGVRNLDRNFATIIRKVAARIAADPSVAPLAVDAAFASEALGAPPHLPETTERTEMAGVVVGLAATSHGGDILFLEAAVTPGGEGVRLRLTGQLGDVMRESAEAALSWVRANQDLWSQGGEPLTAAEIHLHVPAGAVPKDGPSAGVTLATAVVSALTGRRAFGTVAMTGEISLRGRVLPVGGIKGKVMAAARAGVTKVLMPRRNVKDLVEIPEEVLEKVEIVPVDTVAEVLELALEPAAAPPP
jgi:ATP-dependent Lon protease